MRVAKASSSTKKAARLAQTGGGRTIRFQGGTVFPLAVAITLIVGLALIAYARQSQPAADATPPQLNDHWHMAYGFYLCDTWYVLEGALEERDSAGNLANRNYLRTTIHSHDDGVIHWHPYTTVATGKRAVLNIFLDNYGVEVSDTALRFPETPGLDNQFQMLTSAGTPTAVASEWIEGETTCNGEPAELSVVKWDYTSDLDSAGQRYIANTGQIHIDHDGMSFAIMFAPRDTPKVKPPTAANLAELGGIDAEGGSQYTDPSDFVDPDSITVETLGGPADTTATDAGTSDGPVASTPDNSADSDATVTTGG